jgi:UDP-2,3-diacylglucosamine hydrolase
MARRLTLVAGGGDLVPHVAAAIGSGRDAVQILDLVGRGGLGSGTMAASLDRPAELIEAITAFRTTHLLLAGGVHISDGQRQGLAAAFGPAGKIAGGLGDLGLAGMILVYCKMHGIKLVGAHEVAPELVAGEGRIAGPVSPPSAEWAKGALRAARAVGAIDLGQSVVLAGSRAIAAEDAGGTDALLNRVAELRVAGLTGNGGYPLILAKARKPKQPAFVDLPAIGPQTIINAAAAGISLIVVEARATLVLDRAKVEAEAAARQVSVIGARHG